MSKRKASDRLRRAAGRGPVAAALLVCAVVLGAPAARAETLADAMHRAAREVVAPTGAALIDVTRAGRRLVAVGERGLILLSDDNGVSWRQVPVPVSVTLTAVRFLNAQEGWAVGHSGIVLHTTDGGLTWEKQLDGAEAAKLILAAVPAPAAGAPAGSDATAAKAHRLAQQFVDDGPDKPFLDICFGADGTAYVVGAYGLIFASRDHGRTWQSWLSHADNPQGLNLYAMTRVGNALYLAGEQGYFARSTDGGEHFQHVSTPYDGSYFTLNAGAPGDPGALVLVGLRGTIVASPDGGTTWHTVAHDSTVSIDAVATLSDGTLLLADERGNLIASRDGGQSVAAVRASYARQPTAALVQAADGTIVTVGLRGIHHFTLADNR